MVTILLCILPDFFPSVKIPKVRSESGKYSERKKKSIISAVLISKRNCLSLETRDFVFADPGDEFISNVGASYKQISTIWEVPDLHHWWPKE